MISQDDQNVFTITDINHQSFLNIKNDTGSEEIKVIDVEDSPVISYQENKMSDKQLHFRKDSEEMTKKVIDEHSVPFGSPLINNSTVSDHLLHLDNSAVIHDSSVSSKKYDEAFKKCEKHIVYENELIFIPKSENENNEIKLIVTEDKNVREETNFSSRNISLINSDVINTGIIDTNIANPGVINLDVNMADDEEREIEILDPDITELMKAVSDQKELQPQEENIHKCIRCDKWYSSKHHLHKHMRIHTGERPFQCTECPLIFGRHDHLLRHLIIHTDDKPFKCVICEWSFKRKDHLLRHVRTHSTEKNVPCLVCQKLFKSKEDIYGHMKTHTKPYKCSDCDKSFAKRENLNAHMSNHENVKGATDSPLKLNKCPICFKSFTRKSHVTRHMKLHTKEDKFANGERKTFSKTEKGEFFSGLSKTIGDKTLNKITIPDNTEAIMNENTLTRIVRSENTVFHVETIKDGSTLSNIDNSYTEPLTFKSHQKTNDGISCNSQESTNDITVKSVANSIIANIRTVPQSVVSNSPKSLSFPKISKSPKLLTFPNLIAKNFSNKLSQNTPLAVEISSQVDATAMNMQVVPQNVSSNHPQYLVTNPSAFVTSFDTIVSSSESSKNLANKGSQQNYIASSLEAESRTASYNFQPLINTKNFSVEKGDDNQLIASDVKIDPHSIGSSCNKQKQSMQSSSELIEGITSNAKQSTSSSNIFDKNIAGKKQLLTITSDLQVIDTQNRYIIVPKQEEISEYITDQVTSGSNSETQHGAQTICKDHSFANFISYNPIIVDSVHSLSTMLNQAKLLLRAGLTNSNSNPTLYSNSQVPTTVENVANRTLDEIGQDTVLLCSSDSNSRYDCTLIQSPTYGQIDPMSYSAENVLRDLKNS